MASDTVRIYITHQYSRDPLFEDVIALLDSIPELTWELVTDVDYVPEDDPLGDVGLVEQSDDRRRAINRTGVISEADLVIALPDNYEADLPYRKRHIHQQLLTANHNDIPVIAMKPQDDGEIPSRMMDIGEDVAPWDPSRLHNIISIQGT